MRWPYIISLVALLGASLLLFFNILCGATTHAPLNKWYWLQADTSAIPGANSVTRWTNYDTCGVSNGKNTDCSSKKAAYPMSPVSNFGTTEGVPSGLQSEHGSTYHLSKAGWAFLLLGLLFTLLAVIPVLISFCIPRLNILNIGTAFSTITALVFTILSASLLTAAYVKARDAFHDNGNSAKLGKTMFAFIWTSVFLLAVSSILSGIGCMGNFMGQRKKRHSENYDSSSHDTYGNDYTTEKEQQSKRGFFGRKKNTQTEDLEDVGYAAGYGASGATADVSKTRGGIAVDATNAHGNTTGLGYAAGATAIGTTAATVGVLGASSRNPNTGELNTSKDVNKGENLDDVGYAAGVGASGATSDLTKGQTAKRDINAVSSSTLDPKTGETLDDVAYAAGYGASGATSKYTKANTDPSQAYGNSSTGNNTYESKDFANTTGTHVPASKPYDTATAVGATTVGAGAAASSSGKGHDKSAVDTELRDNRYDTNDVKYDINPNNTDVGYGSTRAGLNAVQEEKHDNTYENKSTVLPVGGKHVTSDRYGNQTAGYETGVPVGSARSAATASALGGIAAVGTAAAIGSSKGIQKPVKEGAASSVEDTYTSSNVGLGKTNKDLTNTAGYEPTTYYTNKTGDSASDDVYGTNGGTVGATHNTGTKSTSTGNKDSENLDDVAYAAGLGASGATSDYTKGSVGDHSSSGNKRSTTGTSQSGAGVGAGVAGIAVGTTAASAALASGNNNKSTSGTATGSQTKDTKTGETIDDVAYAAGLGSSGATSDITKKNGLNQETQQKKKTGIAAWFSGGKDKRDSNASSAYDDYDEGVEHAGSSNKEKSTSKGPNGETLTGVGYAAGLGASGATSGYGKNEKSSSNTSASKGPNGETLGDVGYAAGLGASGATSNIDYSKKDSSKTSTSKGPNGETLNDVAYSAGLGASGATSNLSDVKKSTNANQQSSGKSTAGAYSSESYAPSSTTKDQTTDSYGHGNNKKSLADAVVDPSRNRNPIADGSASASLDKPTGNVFHSEKYESNTGDKLRGGKSSYADDSLPGTFPTSSLGQSDTGVKGNDYSNYTTSSGLKSSTNDDTPRSNADAVELQENKEGQEPGLLQQIIDTAKSVI